ncbi:protein of unknown function [Candidatus Hydrogenisulfobacillus filiaventi]|uniref:Uncharacterized protein n=1 Tax=Candidatus Hydrogenisulfobacillus filiaventi TaxID=2707344 RepID=A0A6F8ZD62_9FIRM|nr:protein of unknown function [Candidatus Hydrogenisulfobacillus filiaventi]
MADPAAAGWRERERVRQGFRPPVLRLLLIAEAPRAGPRFFYYGNAVLFFAVRTAFRQGLDLPPAPDPQACLERLRRWGLYVDNLCPAPLPPGTGREAVRVCVPDLAVRLRAWPGPPLAVAAVLRRIGGLVEEAVAGAWNPAPPVAVLPFPRFRQRAVFEAGLAELFRALGPP